MTAPKNSRQIENEEAACRLLLFWPDDGIVPILEGFRSLAGLVVRPEDAGDVVGISRALSVATLVNGDVRIAKDIGADGVIVESTDDIKAARLELGPNAIIGAHCGTSRHAAMLAGESGADYVLFCAREGAENVAALIQLVAWARELIILPVAATGLVSIDDHLKIMGAGADFIMPSRSIWQDPASAATLIASLDRALLPH